MRWNMRAPEKAQPWKRWFAWHPVQPGWENQWVWLETIERQRCYESKHTRFGAFWNYRMPPNTTHR